MPPEETPPDDLPRSPTGRIPQWVVDEARQQRRVQPEPGRSDAPVRVPAGSRRRARSGEPRRYQPWLVGTLVVAAGVAALVRVTPQLAHDPRLSGRSVVQVAADQADGSGSSFAMSRAELPRPGHEEASQPLGAPPAPVPTSTSYAFFGVQGGKPVAWDPCRPVHYVVNEEQSPRGGRQIIEDAVAAVSGATGLRFVDDGDTDEEPSDHRDLVQKGRYGDRWAPVLISWRTEAQMPRLKGAVAGFAGPAPMSVRGGPSVYVTGAVTLDSADLETALSQPSGQSIARAVAMHELGHLVGLAHVDDRDELMNPVLQRGVLGYGQGDLAGLALLGQGVCAPGL